MRCSKCSRVIDASKFPKGTAFCPYCGNVLKQAQNGKKAAIAYCPFCGQGLPSNATFCPNCGKKIPEEPVPQATSELMQSAREEPSEVTKQEGKSLIDYAAGAIKNKISGEGRRNRLFKQWVEFAGLPEESVSDLEKSAIEMEEIRARELEQYYLLENKPKRIPNLYLILGAIAVFIIIVLVVVLVNVLS